MSDGVTQGIIDIATKLGLASERIWPQVVMVTWATSLFWAIADPLIFVGSLIGIVRIWRFSWTQINRANDEYDEATSAVLVCFGAASLLGVLAFLALLGFPDQLAGVLYPEATTVLRIARGLK